MKARLTIRFEGSVEGLEDHHLSVGRFWMPLNKLWIALRSIARELDRENRGAARRGDRGRYGSLAEQMDLRLIRISGGSPTSIELELTQSRLKSNVQPAGMEPPPPDLVLGRFLDGIEGEEAGTPTNVRVRNYLNSLPDGLRRQEYRAEFAGNDTRRIVVERTDSEPETSRAPYLAEIVGEVIAAGFQPGREWIQLKTGSGLVKVAATAAMVETALAQRQQSVRILAVMRTGARHRCLKVLSASEEVLLPEDEEVIRQIHARWGGVLRRLAK